MLLFFLLFTPLSFDCFHFERRTRTKEKKQKHALFYSRSMVNCGNIPALDYKEKKLHVVAHLIMQILHTAVQ